MQNTYENKGKRKILNNQSESKNKQNIHNGFNQNNNTTSVVFKTSKQYSKTVKNQRELRKTHSRIEHNNSFPSANLLIVVRFKEQSFI